MQKSYSRLAFYVSSLLACTFMAMTSGCASGGFKLTRQYAGFVNNQNIIIRIILYILTSVVFAVTMLVDLVIFNTMDFWEGRVAQGTYEFSKDGKNYQVHHEILPEHSLRRSTIQIYDVHHKLMQVVVLSETANGNIEMSVDGKLRAQVRDVHSLPIAAVFDPAGTLTGEKFLLMELPANPVAVSAAN